MGAVRCKICDKEIERNYIKTAKGKFFCLDCVIIVKAEVGKNIKEK